MNDRRMVEHRTTFIGEELVYYVETCESLPEPCQDDPYAVDGRAATVRKLDDPAPVAPVKHRPTKAEYIASFEQACGDNPPAYVTERMEGVYTIFLGMAEHFEAARMVQPRRVRRAMARFRGNDLASFYDTGTIARIRWHFWRHRLRWEREQAAIKAYARSLFEREGQAHPMTLGAVVGAR